MFRYVISFALAVVFWSGQTVRGDQLVTISTALGDIVVQLFEADKPVTSANFLKYVNTGAYSNSFIQRWEPAFVIQGGGWITTNISGNLYLDNVPNFGAITNEYSVGRNFPNTYGTIAMARSAGGTNSASSQWFINLTNRNTFLDTVDGGFTVFGRVVAGTNVVNLFNAAPDTNGLASIVVNAALSLGKVPYITSIKDLVYTKFSVRTDFGSFTSKLGATKANDAVVLKWISIKDKAHTLEASDSWPPQWTTLKTFTGDGAAFFYTNSLSSGPTRFFRMRVEL